MSAVSDAAIINVTNFYLAGIKKAVDVMDDETFTEALQILEKWDAGSVVLLATGMSMQQFDNMMAKVKAMRSLREFRSLVKAL
jgi:hypothetical protein